jgi:VIT1/CCC1 family predicted Fe2+/Mn2+ transporter
VNLNKSKLGKLYLRNTIFGVADSLVSTVGLLAGIGVGGANRSTIITTGVVYAFVEAFSMAVGSFLSEESAEEYQKRKETSHKRPLIGGIIMFVSFVVASFVPLAPYVFLRSVAALVSSIVLAILVLFGLGMTSAKLSNINLLKSGLKMSVLGGAAVILGVVIGYFFRQA